MNIPVKDLLTPNVATMISTWLTLGLMYLLFKKYLFAPTRKFLEQRQKYIMKNIKNSEVKSQEAVEQLDKAQKHLEKTTKESANYLALQMDEAKNKASELVEDAKKDIENLRDSTKESLKVAETKARKNLREEVASLSIAAAKKVLNKEIDDKSAEKLVDEFIKDIQ